MPNLTDRTIRALTAKGDRLAVRDEGTPGLELRVSKGGAKTFAIRYTLADGTRRRMNLGRWPALSLADAREAALGAMRDVARAGDPAQTRKAERDRARSRDVRTLDDLAEALFEVGGVRASTDAYRRWLWSKHLKGRLGDARLEDVAPGRVRRAVREIGAGAGPTTANRALSLLKRILNFGVDEEHISANPIAKLEPMFDEQSRARVLSDDELKALWGLAEKTAEAARQGAGDRDALWASRPMAIGVQLCLITAQRGGEVAGLRRGELDLEARTWLLPAERSKSKREHLVPLSDRAVQLLNEALAFADLRLAALKPEGEAERKPQPSDPVFPSPKGPSRPVARLSLGRAMARLNKIAKIEDASPHDLRRTAATAMASERIGALTEVVGRVLNHAPPGAGVTSIYNRHAYVAEKRRALDAWEGLLLEIVGERVRTSNVSDLRGAAA
ncbi:MAG TPA: site-specific integrase [Caulobacteraceae bacterium]|jgi:integrase|nr:site-specific integrase [Caulobacteraceae bacterium]